MLHFVRHRGLRVLLALLVAAALLPACSSTDPKKITSPSQIYQLAKKALNDSDYSQAIKYYEALEARFPFSPEAKQGQLDLMYAYYKNHATESAIDQADQFIRENPIHPRVDYAYYIKGLTWFERNPNFIERWFRADLSLRPPIDARKSFQAFQTLVQQYPNSEYAADARQRMIFLRNRLANYEVYVANFYLSRGAYVGAINRAKFAIENYDGAPAIRQALAVMVDAYNKLGMQDLAHDTQRVLEQNYSASEVKAAEKKSWWKFW